MKIGIDCGNSSIKCYFFDTNGLLDKKILPSDKKVFHAQLKKGLLNAADFVIISSVVKSIENEIVKYCLQKNIPHYSISLQKIPEISIDYETPETLGADRLLNCAAAMNLFPGENVLIADAGTAVTIEVFSGGKTFNGGMIFPGPGTAAESLKRKTDSLPMIAQSFSSTLIGKSTTECISSGIYNGWACMINGLCDAIEKEEKKTFRKIITGGFADVLKTNSALNDFQIVKNFQLHGFMQIASRQNHCRLNHVFFHQL